MVASLFLLKILEKEVVTYIPRDFHFEEVVLLRKQYWQPVDQIKLLEENPCTA